MSVIDARASVAGRTGGHRIHDRPFNRYVVEGQGDLSGLLADVSVGAEFDRVRIGDELRAVRVEDLDTKTGQRMWRIEWVDSRGMHYWSMIGKLGLPATHPGRMISATLYNAKRRPDSLVGFPVCPSHGATETSPRATTGLDDSVRAIVDEAVAKAVTQALTQRGGLFDQRSAVQDEITAINRSIGALRDEVRGKTETTELRSARRWWQRP